MTMQKITFSSLAPSTARGFAFAASVAVLTSLAACGGGGGNDSTAEATPAVDLLKLMPSNHVAALREVLTADALLIGNANVSSLVVGVETAPAASASDFVR